MKGISILTSLMGNHVVAVYAETKSIKEIPSKAEGF